MEEIEVKSISAEEFAGLDFSKVTLLDLREEDEVLVSGIEGAVNIPFSQIGSRLSSVPKELPVYVFCRTGDWSEEVTEILTERGYEAYNVEGGFRAYREYIANAEPVVIDAKGLKCPGPIVKVADTVRGLAEGRICGSDRGCFCLGYRSLVPPDRKSSGEAGDTFRGDSGDY